MTNLNTFENFASFKPWKLSQDKPDNCPGNCQAQIDADFWLNNQRYWVYKCPCCKARQIEKHQTTYNWGGLYD